MTSRVFLFELIDIIYIQMHAPFILQVGLDKAIEKLRNPLQDISVDVNVS